MALMMGRRPLAEAIITPVHVLLYFFTASKHAFRPPLYPLIVPPILPLAYWAIPILYIELNSISLSYTNTKATILTPPLPVRLA